MRERLFVELSTVVMRIISKSFEVSARKVTQRKIIIFVFCLERYIPTAAAFGGLCIGALSVLADFMGEFIEFNS